MDTARLLLAALIASVGMLFHVVFEHGITRALFAIAEAIEPK